MELWQLLGELHPRLVQFPLVLLLAGLVADAIGLLRRRRDDRFHWAAVILTSAGTVLLLIAFVCGIYAEIWAGRAGVPQDPIEWHEFLANVSSWGFVILAAWRLFLQPAQRRRLVAYTTIGLIWYGMIALTAYFGGQLVTQYGASVTGAQATAVLSIHDLNTLATRQTDLNLKYSELMHHVAGCMTLALSGALLINVTMPKRGRQLWWIGPGLFLAGGVALFFFADLDLYHLTDLRQLRDREVQLHKAMATLLVIIGAVGLRRGKAAAAAVSFDETTPIRNTSKIVAVTALIGGSLLFTHVHTVAPYANVAAGVYIAHMVMGTVALAIGAARLLQDAMPQWRRPLAAAFAILMLVESTLLITYNEGLPWFIGYGRYNRWGPHGGTVAPLGDSRAELTFDNNTQRLDVYLLDRFKNDPAGATPTTNTRQPQLVIAQGYRETAVNLRPVDASERSPSHFHVVAPWLKDVPAFSAKLSLGDSSRVGYFDPWVAPVIRAVPPNEVARFQCPMHDGVLSTTPGTCPLCEMSLVPVQVGARKVMHEPRYEMRLNATPQPPPVAEVSDDIRTDDLERLLTFTPTDEGQTLRNLPIVHEHPMHMTVVSRDLAFFDHVHPIPQPDGSLQLQYRFPRYGDYVVFAEFTPIGQRDQVFRYEISVRGEQTTPQMLEHSTAELMFTEAGELSPSPAGGHPIADHPDLTAELTCQPRTPAAGISTMLVFHLARGGQPLTDLEPYMGAMGHCAIISADTVTFLHCHPEQLYPPTLDTRGGPVLAFHAVFPKPGRYKIWGQFKRQGRVIIADFEVDVRKPLLPAKVVNFILND
jgi:uncharacterized membrane protein